MLRQNRINVEGLRELTAEARRVAKRSNVLYHGTRYVHSILSMGTIFHSFPGEPQVALTRSPETAAYFALLPRDDDEGQGAILIFDRQSLQSRYRIERWHDTFWDDAKSRNDEMEERIWEDITDVGRHLLGMVSGPMTPRSDRVKKFNHLL